jgi:hypothetical protein
MSDGLTLSIRGCEILCGISLLIQTLEFLRLTSVTAPKGVWAYEIQGGDLSHASPYIQAFFGFMARELIYRWHLILRLFATLALIAFGASLPLILFLFLGTLLLLTRWRGAFNGGSDFMTIVVLTGLLIGALGSAMGQHEIAWQAGLIYIAIHSASSYFLSGGVKLFNPDWRSGKALPLFLDGGIYGPLASDSLFRNRAVAILCSWAFILWETAIPIAFLNPVLMLLYCGIGIVFHFLVFWFFGLNRFFFAWLATYPALIFAAIHLA